jgi:hypothetical protein
MATLSKATADIKCHKDGKDADTVCHLYIKGGNKVTCASANLTGVVLEITRTSLFLLRPRQHSSLLMTPLREFLK